MANIFEQLMSQNRELTQPKKVVKTESHKIPVTKIKLESRKIFEEEDLDVIDDKFSVDLENPENDEVVLVIDPELPAEGEDEPEVAADEMVGDLVYKCPVCGANYLCDCDHLEEEGIEVDDEGEPIACPICGDESDQILVGEIAPAEDVKEEDEVEFELQSNENEDEGEGDSTEGEVKETEKEEDEVKVEDESVNTQKRFVRRPRINKESTNVARRPVTRPLALNTSRVAENTTRTGRRPFNRPVLKKVSEGKKPMPRTLVKKADYSHFDEAKLESLMNKFLAENYKGNLDFKVKDVCRNNKGAFKVEYIIRNGNKLMKRGALVAENISRLIRFVDASRVFTESANRKPAFMVECKLMNNTVIPFRLSCDFTKKVNESVYAVKGSYSLTESK